MTANVGGKKFIATLDRVDVLSAEAYAWEGTIRVGDEAYGTITLINQDGEITGAVRVDDVNFQIEALENDLYALTEVNVSKLPVWSPQQDYGKGTPVANAKVEAEAAPEQTESLRNDLDALERNTENAPTPVETQRVLVLYNLDAAQAVNDIRGTVALAIQDANNAYSRSRVSNLRLELAGVEWFTFETFDDIRADVNRLRNSSQAQILRNRYNADVVVLLTDANYTSGFLGWAQDIHPTAEDAYAIVEADHAATSDYIFAHELGHLQSAQHHPDDGVNTSKPYSSFARGHRFESRKRFIGIPIRTRRHSTVMAYPSPRRHPDERWPTIQNFSNPDVEYYDVDTGTSMRNSARVLRTTARRVASFRGVGAMSASVSHTNSGNHYTFRANTSGAVGTLTYEWYRSLNSAGNYGGVVSRQQSYPTTIYPDNILYVKVIVRSSSGQIATAYGSAYSPPSNCQQSVSPV